MIGVPLAALANQSFFVQLDERVYTIALRTSGNADLLSVDITRDDVVLVQGLRVAPGTPLLPYHYQESGNFILATNDGDLPNFEQLGLTQFLAYVSAAELVELRG